MDACGASHCPQTKPVLLDTTASVNCEKYVISIFFSICIIFILCHFQTSITSEETRVEIRFKSKCVSWSRISGWYFLSTWTALPFHPINKQETLHICNIHTRLFSLIYHQPEWFNYSQHCTGRLNFAQQRHNISTVRLLTNKRENIFPWKINTLVSGRSVCSFMALGFFWKVVIF